MNISSSLGPLVGRAIARERQRAALTQSELAEKLNMGNEAISRMERGLVIPSLPRLIELAEALGCEATALISETSPVAADQNTLIARQLQRLGARDRRLVLHLIDQMSQADA